MTQSTPVHTTTLSTEDVSRKMAKGAAWMVALRLADRGFGIVNTMILARLLVPQDFGLVAMATALLGMIEIMSTFSFDLALIQNQKAERRHYDTAWTFNVLFGAATGVLLAALAVPAAVFYAEPRVEAIVYLLACAAFMQGFQNIGVVAFRKELDFRKEFVLVALQRLVAVLVTLVLAFALRSYWALVVGMLTSRISGVFISYWLHSYRPRLSLAGARDLMRFSGWMLVNNYVIFGATKGYDFVIGRGAGAHGLGLYTVAYEISNLPTTELVFPVSRALFPGFSKLASNRDGLKTVLLRVAGLVALVTIPAGVGVAVLAEPLVKLVLGPQWLQAVPLIRVLALYGVLRALHAGTSDTYLALGMQRVLISLNVPHIVVGWPLTIALMHVGGVEAAVWGILCAAAIGVGINLATLVRVLGIPASAVAGCYWRPVLAALCMLAVELALLGEWGPHDHAATLAGQTVLYVITGAASYAACLLGLWWLVGRPDGAERTLVQRLMHRTGLVPSPSAH